MANRKNPDYTSGFFAGGIFKTVSAYRNDIIFRNPEVVVYDAAKYFAAMNQARRLLWGRGDWRLLI